jgi:geranyl-CoA carboxylase alpha subunit
VRPFAKVLIANRGEIARRVLRAVRAEGLRSVAVYSDADRAAPHVLEADEAVRLGPAAAVESYLDAERVIAAARASGADAVHPGYGFLSEHAAFARACGQAGLVFIGPSAETIELMGNKRRAKQAVRQAGVPCIPGYAGEQSDARLAAEALALGFPLVIKAAAGGGGRGIRLVRDARTLATELALARAEARSAFGDDELMLERAMLGARHVEVQVLADVHGTVLHLGERDCSVQRRHQKVVEEAPSPAVDTALRARLGEAAVGVARACAYAGAGTVEFLVDATGRFYFLEMNTRIQVEHPVTEAVTGIDLVAWQLRIAAGARLRLRQEEVPMEGHALEARLYAEDPGRGFLPQSGRILRWQAPEGAGIRVEHALRAGAEVGVHYDPLLAKLIACGPDRERARVRLIRALEDTVVLGVATNKAFLLRVLEDPGFAAGRAATDFLDGWIELPHGASPEAFALAAALFYTRVDSSSACEDELMNWCNSGEPRRCSMRLTDGARELSAELFAAGTPARRFTVILGERRVELELELHADRPAWVADGLRRALAFAFEGDTLHLDTGRGELRIEDLTYAHARAQLRPGDGRVQAPMAGVVHDVLVASGARVARGQGLVVVESMKMLHTIAADVAGTVAEVLARAGDVVHARQLLAVLLPAPHAEGGDAP